MVTGVTIPRGSKNCATIPTTVLLVGSDSVMYRATSLMLNTNSSLVKSHQTPRIMGYHGELPCFDPREILA